MSKRAERKGNRMDEDRRGKVVRDVNKEEQRAAIASRGINLSSLSVVSRSKRFGRIDRGTP